MPLYEYQCKKCGSVFEVLQKVSDPPLTVHDNCGGKLKKLLSPPALQFKGSGWYVTDYAKGSKSGSAPPRPEAKDGKAGASKPPAESKPAPVKE